MRRLSLSAKLSIAALPLLVVLAVLLGVLTRDNLREVDAAERGADLGSTWQPLITTIRAIESEQAVGVTGSETELAAARQITDGAMVAMNDHKETRLGDPDPLTFQLGEALYRVGLARAGVDAARPRSEDRAAAGLTDFDRAESALITLGRLLSDEAGDEQLSSELTAIAALAEVEQTGASLVESVQTNLGTFLPSADFDRSRFLVDELDRSMDLFQSAAPEAWVTQFREAGFRRAVDDAMRGLEPLWAFDAATAEAMPTVDIESLNATVTEIATFRDALAADIITRSDAAATDLQRSTFVELGIVGGAVLFAGLLAAFVVRSITRRVRKVSAKANEVATSQLPALVEAMRDPRGRASLPAVAPLDDKGADEVAELASAFDAVQHTLVDVAQQQVEVLRRGVSDIFVTMARRNRSLVDRQLALLDELEAEVDDPEVLSNYYQLDHLATRMRRNSESLLVLANTETKRRRTKATEIDDVVRAAIGEVEDYRRVDVMSLDSLQVRGDVVADVSHLLAEVIDNATSFSPPDTRVRVSGRQTGNRYLVTIADEGMGVTPDRMAELNDLLASPPVVGLSVEPTLGMSVVSLLANKHAIDVALSAGSPGVVVEVSLPPTIYGPIDGPDSSTDTGPIPRTASREPDVLVEWIDSSHGTDTFVAAAPVLDTVLPVHQAPANGHTADAPVNGPLNGPLNGPENGWVTDQVTGPENGHAPARLRIGETAPFDPAITHEPVVDAPVQRVAEAGVDPTPAPAIDSALADDGLGLTEWDLTPSWVRADDQPVSASVPVVQPVVEPVVEPAIEPVVEPVVAPTSDQQHEAPSPAAAAPHLLGDPLLAPPTAASAVDLPPPPPPPATSIGATAGEFDRAPAPPSFGAGPVQRPVVDPVTARPLPPRKPLAPAAQGGTGIGAPPALPSRVRNGNGQGAAAVGGPDRIERDTSGLPTRRPGEAFTPDADAAPTQASKLDADAIRERLRSFQHEYRIGRSSDGRADRGPDHGSDRGVE
jgi:signal transduction histidine kinase